MDWKSASHQKRGGFRQVNGIGEKMSLGHRQPSEPPIRAQVITSLAFRDNSSKCMDGHWARLGAMRRILPLRGAASIQALSKN